MRFFARLVLAGVILSSAAMVAASEHRIGPEPGVEMPYAVRVELDRDGKAEAFLKQLRFNVDAAFYDWARVYVVDEELEKLLAAGFTATRLPDDGPANAEAARRRAMDLYDPARAGEESVPAVYHTYATLTADLQQIAADHPSIVRLMSIGQTVQGREMWFVKLTDNPDVEEYEPGFTYISSMHGDEVVGKELLYNLLDYMTDNYGTDPRVTNLIDSTEIWIMPSMNPDGTELGGRTNANGMDLNRDFPDQWVDPVNTAAGREVETANVMAWRAQHTSSLSMNFHGGALVANYPFDSTPSGASNFAPAPDPDHDTFVMLARTYADNNSPMSTSNSHPAWDNGITNGSDWYAIFGGMQDWEYLWHGDREVLAEVSDVKWPSASELPTFWSENQESLLAYMERVHEGLRGLVTDADSGLPLAATVHVGTSPNPSYTDPEVGDYHHVVVPGTYEVTVSAPGHESKVIPGVVVTAGPAAVLDVQLGPQPVQLQPYGFTVLDGGNGFLEPAEIATLRVELENLGKGATTVNAELVPTGWYGSVVQPLAAYPDIPTATTAQSAAPHHQVALDASAPPGHRAGYALQWTTDQGVGQSEAFFIDTGVPQIANEASIDVPKTIVTIPVPSFVASLLNFPQQSEIIDVRVTIDLTHTYIGDLVVDLVAPSGTRVLLHNRGGGSQSDIVGTYGVDLTPAQPLSAFIGEMSAGTWTLEVTDDALGDGGTLNAWTLEIDGRPAEVVPPQMRFRRAEMRQAGARFEWWPYPGMTSYRIYRSTDPSQAAAFVDVTSEDGDSGDTVFDDNSVNPMAYFLVTGVGPGGEGPKGHFGE